MRVALVVALLSFGIALSGCSSGSDKEEAPADLPLEVSSDTNTTAPLPNQLPIAGLTASLVNGTAPLNVTFNMTGSDADGDNLTWTLDADGDNVTEANGTALPAMFNFTYATNGTFNATFTVSDGTNMTSSTIAINVTAAAATIAGTVQHFEGSWPGGAMGCAARPAGTGSIYVDVFLVETPVDPLSFGHPYTAVFSPTPDTLDVYVEFLMADGSDVDGGGSTAAAPWTVSGTVPDGAEVLRFINCGAAGASVTYDA